MGDPPTMPRSTTTPLLALLALILLASPTRAQSLTEADPDEPASAPVPAVRSDPRTPEGPEPTRTTTTAAETPEPSKTSTTTHPAPPAAPSLTWSRTSGPGPLGGAIAEVTFGFSGLPRAAYHWTVDERWSVGVAAGFDIAQWNVRAAFDPTFLLAVPVRLSTQWQAVRLGLRTEVGFFASRDRGPGLSVEVAGHLGWMPHPQWVVGAMLAMPTTLGVRTPELTWPILVGPFAEVSLIPGLNLTFESAFGPAFSTLGPTNFGMRLQAGLAYRL